MVPALPPEVLLKGQSALMERLQQSLGLELDEFNRLVVPVVLRYVERVHLLPASESDHHCGRGGLLRHGIEAACFAARLAEGRLFALNVEPEYRKTIDPKWRLATVFAALMHDLGKVVIDVNAVSEDGTHVWNGHGPSLWEWTQRHGLTGYYVRWNSGRRGNRHASFGAVLVREILGADMLEHLSCDGARDVMDKMVLAFTQPEARSTNIIASLASDAEQSSVEFDLEDQAKRAIAAGGSPDRSNGMLIVRAMGRLVNEGEWKLNTVGHPLWLTTSGLFGLMPDILKGPIDRLSKEGKLKGVPRNTGQIIDLLTHHRFITLTPEGQPFWMIDIASESATVGVTAIQLALPDVVMGDSRTAPANVRIRALAPTEIADTLPVSPTVASRSSQDAADVIASQPSDEPAGTGADTPSAGGAPNTDSTTTALLSQIGQLRPKAGMVVVAMIQDLLNGRRVWGKDADFFDGRVIFAYPDMFVGHGMGPLEQRNDLNDSGWIVVDPASQKMVVEIEKNGIKISGCFGNEDLSRLMYELLKSTPSLTVASKPLVQAVADDEAVPTVITKAHLTEKLPHKIPKHIRMGFKRQMYAGMRSARITPNSTSLALSEFVTSACVMRDIHKGMAFELLSLTPNPVLTVGNDKKAYRLSPDFDPESNDG